jgi:UDP-N-acetylglucosamine kinase
MTPTQALEWAKNKQHQQKVVADVFAHIMPSPTKVAIFLAGIPGAGKTEFADNTIKEKQPRFVSIEHDKLVESMPLYDPSNYYNYRKAGSRLVSALYTACLSQGYAFIFDGTLSHPTGARNVERALKAGYRVIVIYIVQDAQKAWQLTVAREKDVHRAIEREGFISTCNSINQNLLHIFNKHAKNQQFDFWILNKRGRSGYSDATAIIHGASQPETAAVRRALRRTYKLDKI